MHEFYGSTTPDTISYYNLDYSFWKMIPCPAIPGYSLDFVFGDPGVGVNYSSENLFNTDTFLEAAINYTSLSNLWRGKVLIINENGLVEDSIVNILASAFAVYNINSSTFIAVVQAPAGPQIYNLPGTIPCDACGSSSTLGLAKKEEQPLDLLSSPVPNPSSNQVKITFTLPEGASKGELTIFNTEGKMMRTYTVDNRFGFIMVDDSQFAPGMYYYNLSVNGVVSSSQKMVVIK